MTRTLYHPQSLTGGVQLLVPDRGRGIKRTILVHLNTANTTGYFAHDPETLRSPDTRGNQQGFPVSNAGSGAATPYQFIEWEGPMYGASAADGTQVEIEEASVSGM